LPLYLSGRNNDAHFVDMNYLLKPSDDPSDRLQGNIPGFLKELYLLK